MTMAVSIYTSRVILENLGVIDFGIYNVVGGIVGMFSFLSNSMLDATQRYLNFHLGKMDYDQINRVFSTSVNIFFLIGIIVILLSEIIGFYLLKTKLNIPDERYSTAIIVFQLSLFASFITISSTPYNALIISHEKMTAFAFVSIVQSILTLVTAISLMYVKSDKLILYALMIACIHVGVRLFYSLYCKAKFKEIRYKFLMDMLSSSLTA